MKCNKFNWFYYNINTLYFKGQGQGQKRSFKKERNFYVENKEFFDLHGVSESEVLKRQQEYQKGILKFYKRGIWGWDDWALLPKRDDFWENEQVDHMPIVRVPFASSLITSEYLSKLTFKGIGFALVGALSRPFWCVFFSIAKTRKNIFFNISDLYGRNLLVVSAGLFSIPKRKRLSPQALEPLFTKVIDCLKQYRITNVILRLKIKARFLFVHVLRLFREHKITVRSIFDKIPMPHNGIRSKKQRRL